jgi:hypothetical protein
MAQRTEREWADLDARYDVMKRQTGWDTAHMADALGVKRQTLRDRLKTRMKLGTLPDDVNPWLDEAERTPTAHPSTPTHQGTLEEYREVMEEVHHSVPEAPHIGTDEVHPSTPEVHPEVSEGDSSVVHSGVPARQTIRTPIVHPGTPTEEDWELWATMKGRWTEVEKMLADWQSRRRLLSTPSGTPRHTIKKTYVVDRLYIEMIDQYAREQGVEIKDVVNLAFREFFERREYLSPERTTS